MQVRLRSYIYKAVLIRYTNRLILLIWLTGDLCMKVQAICFDLDGTLLNTIDDIADAVNAALRKAGFKEYPIAAYKYFVGDGMKKLAKHVLPSDVSDDIDFVAKFLEEMQKQYKLYWDKKTKAYDGIPELLNELQKRNIKCAIVSNKPHEFTLLNAAKFLSEWKFDVILGATTEIAKKPDSAMSHEVARRLSLDPKECMHVGDTGTDMLTARNAGMYAVGVTWGFREYDELEVSGAHSIIHHPSELLSLLEA